MRIALPDWIALAHFAGLILVVTLYGLAVAAHFPAESRTAELRTGAGAAILWGTAAVTALAAAAAVGFALTRLPGYAAVIAGGLAILAGPLALKLFPDRFLDGRAGLAVFAAGAAVLAVLGLAA